MIRMFGICALILLSSNGYALNRADYAVPSQCSKGSLYKKNMLHTERWKSIAEDECNCSQLIAATASSETKYLRRSFNPHCIRIRLENKRKEHFNDFAQYVHDKHCKRSFDQLNTMSSTEEIQKAVSNACSKGRAHKLIQTALMKNGERPRSLYAACGSNGYELYHVHDTYAETFKMTGDARQKKERYNKKLELLTQNCTEYALNVAKPRLDEFAAEERKKRLEEKQKRIAAEKRRKERELQIAKREAEKKAKAEKALAEHRAKHAAAHKSLQEKYQSDNTVGRWVNTEDLSTSSRNTYKDQTDALNALALAFDDMVNTHVSHLQKDIKDTLPGTFVPPTFTKGEFEKTSVFERRKALAIAEAKRKWEWGASSREAKHQRAKKALNDYHAGKHLAPMLGELISKNLGSPKITAVHYNADREVFNVTVAMSSARDLSLTAEIPMSLSTAKVEKDNLKNMNVEAYFKVAEDRQITPTGIILHTEDKLYHGKVVKTSATGLTFDTTIARATKYRAAKARQVAAEKKRAAEESKKREAARRKERSTWPNGAIAKLRSGTTLCASWKSAMKVSAIRRANNPYVANPGDCFTTNKVGYVVERSYGRGGLSKVRLHGASMNGFVPSDAIFE